MRVPTYTKQTAVTNKTGATAFSVSANPSALSAGLSGLATLAGTVENYMVNELKERRQSELTAKENQYKLMLQDLQVEMSTQDPALVMEGGIKQGVAVKSYDQKAKEMRDSLGLDIKSSVVRKRFLSSAAQEALQERVSVYQDARNREIDANKAINLQAAELAFQDAAQGSGNKRKNALLKLFGGVDAGGNTVIGIFDNMAQRRYLTDVQALTYTQNYKQRLDRSEVRGRLTSADKSNDPSQAAQIIQDIGNPKNFTSLKPEDRDTAMKQAVDLEQALRKRQIASLEKQEKTDKRDQTKRHQDNARALLAKVQRFKANPDNETYANQLPGLLEITEALTNDLISETSAKLLTGLINDQDAEQRDPELILDIFNKIGDAQGPDEIDEQLNRLDGKIGTGGTVPLSDAINLQKYGDSKKTKTRESDDIKFYEGQLNDLTGQTAFRLSGIGVGADEIERQVDAADTYRRLVLDPEKPVKPRDAFLQVAEQFARARKARINFLAPAAFLQRHFQGESPETWTSEGVSAARQSIENDPNMSQLEKALEFETLDLIITEIRKIQEAAVVGDAQDGDTTESSWFSNLSIFNNNSLRDQQRDLRNPD